MSMRQKCLCFAIAAAGWLAGGSSAAAPITYTGFVVTDVSLDGHRFHNASVYLKFTGDTANIQSFEVTAADGKVGSGWQISQGTASVVIISGRRVIHARFQPNQIVVAFDSYNGGAGFSSLVGSDHHLEPGYPLALDGTTIFDMIDLATTGAWSGHAWSCIGYPPAALGNARCLDPDPYPLQTDHGPFVIYMPYFATDASGSIVDPVGGAINMGILSISVQ